MAHTLNSACSTSASCVRPSRSRPPTSQSLLSSTCSSCSTTTIITRQRRSLHWAATCSSLTPTPIIASSLPSAQTLLLEKRSNHVQRGHSVDFDFDFVLPLANGQHTVVFKTYIRAHSNDNNMSLMSCFDRRSRLVTQNHLYYGPRGQTLLNSMRSKRVHNERQFRSFPRAQSIQRGVSVLARGALGCVKQRR